MSWQTIFQDAEGDWNIAEIGGAVSLAAMQVGFVREVWKGLTPDLQAYGLGVAAILGAIGAAQRLRGDADRKKDQ